MVKKAFSGGALILADMDGHDFNMPTNSDTIIEYFAWRGLAVPLIFMSKKKKNNNIYIYINICKKVDWKPEGAIYTKGELKEREREKMQKVDWKPERAVYTKGEQKKECERTC